ncbi:MAG: n-acetylglutamate synthase [Chitinophagales bacterium]|nr:n-acetylglutamate synthase [Chitinophagales bacterium]
MNYDSKVFKLISTSSNGSVDTDVRFYYHQKGDIIWGEYVGGPVKQGQILGKVNSDGVLSFSYHHIDQENEIKTGNCVSTPELMPNGKVRLHEEWQWTSGDMSKGESIVEEIERRTLGNSANDLCELCG